MGMHQGFDLSRFKKVASDKTTTTLRHTNGHEIKLAHGGLTPKMKADLDKLPIFMADGGDTAKDLGQWASNVTSQPMDDASPEEADAAPAATLDKPALEVDIGGPSSYTTDNQAPDSDQQPQNPPSAQEMTAQDLAWDNDLKNGHITPETYQQLFDSKSTLGKIGTLFGLMVGGGPSTNAAYQMMTNEIQNDLHAQQQSKSNALNYYNAYGNMLRNVSEADLIQTNAALNKMSLSAGQYLFDAGSKLPPGGFQNNYMNALGNLQQAIHIQNAARNQQTEQAIQQRAMSTFSQSQADNPENWNGPVNGRALAALGMFGPKIGLNGNPVAEGAAIRNDRAKLETYKKGVKELDDLTAGEGTSALSEIGKFAKTAGTSALGALAGGPVGAVAGGALSGLSSGASSFAEKYNTKRAAIIKASGLPEEYFPSIVDLASGITGGGSTQAARNAKVNFAMQDMARQENNDAPTIAAAEAMHPQIQLRTPMPYTQFAQEYAAGHSGKTKAKVRDKKRKIPSESFNSSDVAE